MERFTHYGIGMMPAKLREWAHTVGYQQLREKLKQFNEKTWPIFVYSGSSGVACATALAMEYDARHPEAYGMMYVRKANEKSHGVAVEAALCEGISFRPAVLVFVDDFVSGGDTRQYTMQKALGAFAYGDTPLVPPGTDPHRYIQITADESVRLYSFEEMGWVFPTHMEPSMSTGVWRRPAQEEKIVPLQDKEYFAVDLPIFPGASLKKPKWANKWWAEPQAFIDIESYPISYASTAENIPLYA